MNEQKSKGCPKCGRLIYENLEACPHCGYKFAELNAYFNKMERNKFDTVGSKYAGFLKRFIAFLVDIIFVTLVCLIFISFAIIMQYNIENYIYILSIFIIFWIYKIVLEGTISTTIGKKIVGIEVATSIEEKINFSDAIIRNISIILDVLTLGIGIIMILFTEKKVALHDIVSKTLVINSKEEMEFDDYAPGVIRLLAFALDIAILFGIGYLINMGVIYLEENYIMSFELARNIEIIETTLICAISFFYFVLMESSSGRSTIGKKMLGIRIETINGDKMNILTSFIRTVCLFIEIITLGFMLCLITNKKQTLKDRIVDTKVIRI